jgi:hypothetical protein
VIWFYIDVGFPLLQLVLSLLAQQK